MRGGRMDQAKGRGKKAAGDVIGNRRLGRRGRVDRSAGDAKRGVGGLANGLKRVLRRGR